MLDKPFLWHPVFVHFSVALLIMAALFYLLTRLWREAASNHQWIAVARWNLWIGFASSLLTAILGWVAFNTVEHDDAVHALMETHAAFALATVCVFAVPTAWSIWRRRRREYPSWWFVGVLLIGAGLLTVTGRYGGKLVYAYGLGVDLPPAVQAGAATQETEPPKAGDVHVHDGHSHRHE